MKLIINLIKQTEMTLKRTEVVMLPTKKGRLYTSKVDNNRLYSTLNGDINIIVEKDRNITPQYLYFLSDEEIKVGDWCIMLDDLGNVFSKPQQYLDTKTQFLNKGLKKIIATTDKSLETSDEVFHNTFKQNLPQPSDEFIKVFIEEYNKGNIIEWVDAEYEKVCKGCGAYPGEGFSYCTYPVPDSHQRTLIEKLKVNSKNEIAIHPIKDSWNKEEVERLIWKAVVASGGRKEDLGMGWIKENL